MDNKLVTTEPGRVPGGGRGPPAHFRPVTLTQGARLSGFPYRSDNKLILI